MKQRIVYSLILLGFLGSCSATLSPNKIEVLASKRGRFVGLRNGTNPTLTVDEPFSVHIYTEDDATPFGLYCANLQYKMYHIARRDLKKDNNNPYYYIVSANYTQGPPLIATAEMNGTWKCMLQYIHDHEKEVQIPFDFSVDLQKPESVATSRDELAVDVEAEPDTARLLRMSEAPTYINVSIYKDHDQNLLHYTESKLKKDKPFTIFIYFGEEVVSTSPSTIVCFKKTHPTSVYVNQSLTRNNNTAIDSSIAYVSIPPADWLSDDWKCEISWSNPSPYAKIKFSFPVKIDSSYTSRVQARGTFIPMKYIKGIYVDDQIKVPLETYQ